MKAKRASALPILLLLALAVTRVPGFLPDNFSAAYALAFCAGVFLPGRAGWMLPLGLLFGTDVLLNLFVYQVGVLHPMALVNYAVFASLILLGRRFSARDSWSRLLGGGLLGAILFYLLTNTAAWLFNPFHNPEYTKSLAGWIIALTKGTGGYPETWTFFRNTLLSGGLFTGLFVGALRFSEALEPKEAEEPEPAEESEPAQPEETKA